MELGKISSGDLSVLLDLYVQGFAEEQEARAALKEDSDQCFAPGLPAPTWCHLYELPAQEHFSRVACSLGAGNLLQAVGQSPDQVAALQAAVAVAVAEIEAWVPTEDEAAELRKNLGNVFAMSVSVTMSMRALMTFGVYMNDLIAAVRGGGDAGDRALLSAVKIDPTVLGCPTVVARMSRAVMLDDQKFLGKVRSAMNGKLTKREQKNYQQMRVVLQVLHETGATKLSQDDLYTLFVEELRLASREREVDAGSVANNLRQFAYQFLKQKRVSENASKTLAG